MSDLDVLALFADLLDRSLGDMPLALMAVEPDGRVRVWSEAAERMFGWREHEVIGRPLPFIPAGSEAQADGLRGEALTHELQGVRIQRVRRDGAVLHVRLWTARIRNHSGAVVAVLGFLADETALRAQEESVREQTRRIHLLQQVAIAANEADALEPALRRTLMLVCEYTGWPLGHAFVVDANRQMRATALWHLTGEDRYEPLRRATEARRVGEEACLPERVARSGAPEWAVDLETQLTSSRAAVASRCGLRAALAFPVLIRREVVGVLEFFCPEALAPTPALTDVMFHVGTQLGRIAERMRASQERAQLLERVRQADWESARARREQALSPLTLRERDVLRHVASGFDNLQIASRLSITERTVKAHLSAILKKLDLNNRTQAARFAWQNGLGETEEPG